MYKVLYNIRRHAAVLQLRNIQKILHPAKNFSDSLLAQCPSPKLKAQYQRVYAHPRETKFSLMTNQSDIVRVYSLEAFKNINEKIL